MHLPKHLKLVFSIFMSTSMILASCGQPSEKTPEIIIETVVVRETAEIGERVVTPTPEHVKFEKEDKTTINFGYANPSSLDPGWAYELGSMWFIFQVYETLIFYERQYPNKFVPQLATDWEISEDGKTYTFKIREGVQFHGGQDLTPEDVAYSFQRALLQGGSWSPMKLLTEPFFGIGIYDIAELVDPALVDDKAGLLAADPDDLLAACEQVTKAIVADDEAWTVTMTLAQPWGPLLPTLVGSWASILDKGWSIEQGAWDGDCATWQEYYGVDNETAPLSKIMNGTGPYKLDHWTPGEEIVLLRNESYWRTEPAWEGGPSGPASIQRVVLKDSPEGISSADRFLAGDIDSTHSIPTAGAIEEDPRVGERCDWDPEIQDVVCTPTEHPDGPFRVYLGYPKLRRADVYFVFDINDEGGNPYLGSGKLDGMGIPPDFFSDLHVRKAFNYCFDWEAYIQDAWDGKAVQNVGVILPNMPGYDPNGSKYSFDLEKCQEQIELAWDGEVARNGFRMQIVYIGSNKQLYTAAQILQSNFQQIDLKYRIEIVGLTLRLLNELLQSKRLPMFISGWQEDIHDPHNWVIPCALHYASYIGMPEEIRSRYSELINAGVAATNEDERARIYRELQEYDYEVAMAIRLAVGTYSSLDHRWLNRSYVNPIYPGMYLYAESFE
jgi:peptide/nickel transport system substrate-binding protein